MDEVECTVIGAGVIGLAIARALARDGRGVMILERERHFGSQTSSRNSEVIHAGIYYEPGSLKARSCVAGRELLYRYCDHKNISHRRCGKFIVASSERQMAQLRDLDATARRNGVCDLEWLDGPTAVRMEPALSCRAALSSPSTGIIDSHGYMLSLLADAQAGGADIAYGAEVGSLTPTHTGVEISLACQTEPLIRSRLVVNSAGLDAARVAGSIHGFPSEYIPQIRYAKGSYFTLRGRTPFQRLIYPVPEDGGLGVHMTIDLAGHARFGPDVEWVDHLDYDVDPNRSLRFYPSVRQYWPGLAPGQLQPAYCGIRPKLSGPGEAAADFCISAPKEHGIPGIFNLYGMESPGLTASLALADDIAEMIKQL
ncbi:MAG: NAD(P)/FAD-dependent oxidoreductase [Pseudomonadota bacterium]|nr:NAD(P)/FAD-dependent oxidoreductase [Pseudomonadota bacterium]